jgi:hypothetical protein
MVPRWRPLAAALLLAAGCREPVAPAVEKPVVQAASENLLTLPRGAVVIARTGEAWLGVSAIQAIDTDPASFWATPPADVSETMTIALGGEAEIRRIGFSRGGRGKTNLARTLAFEHSLDGGTFAPLGTVTMGTEPDAWTDVAPARARFLRVTTVDGFVPSPQHLRVPTLLATGSLKESPRASIDGGWTINGVPTWFESSGNRVRGVTREDPPRLLEGGWDGRVLRLAWSRKNEHGAVALVLDPAGRHLNGILWYLWPHRPFFGTSWFGVRTAMEPPPMAGPSPQTIFLRSDGRYPLYGLSFEGEQLTPHSTPTVQGVASLIGRAEPRTFRFVAHHVGTETAEFDRRLAAARLDRLRAALRDVGVDLSRVEFEAAGRTAASTANDRPWTPLQVVLNNRIDLELTSPQRR